MSRPSVSRSETEGSIPVPHSVFTPDQLEALKSWTSYYPYPIMGLLEALRCVQQWFSCIRPEHEAHLAKLFGTSVSHVHQVATFFPMFTRQPAGRRRVGICHGISCAMAGADAMAACLEKTLGVPQHQATPDGKISWERMECLGACDFAPALLVDERLKGKATERTIEELARE